jgi:hypothetical protein
VSPFIALLPTIFHFRRNLLGCTTTYNNKETPMKKVKVLVGFLCLFSGYVAAAASSSDKDVAQAVDHLTDAMLHKNIARSSRH